MNQRGAWMAHVDGQWQEIGSPEDVRRAALAGALTKSTYIAHESLPEATLLSDIPWAASALSDAEQKAKPPPSVRPPLPPPSTVADSSATKPATRGPSSPQPGRLLWIGLFVLSLVAGCLAVYFSLVTEQGGRWPDHRLRYRDAAGLAGLFLLGAARILQSDSNAHWRRNPGGSN